MSPLQMTRLAWGKARRFFHGFRPKNVQERLGRRNGACIRCGACCKLLFDCPFLEFDEEGKALCRVYNSRPFNCRIFPVDQRCIAERDLVSPETKCGYWFSSAE